MTLNDLPYPLRLCVELLVYAGMSCPKTQDMTASQIKEAASVFFDDATITEATDILCGRAKNIYVDGELQTVRHPNDKDHPVSAKILSKENVMELQETPVRNSNGMVCSSLIRRREYEDGV